MPYKDRERIRKYYRDNKGRYNKYTHEGYLKDKERINKRNNEYYAKNKERLKEHRSEYGKKYNSKKENKDRRRNLALQRRYGITSDEYNKLFESQNGCCSICNRHQGEFKRTFAVDHNHKTGKIRGLLCDNCNHIVAIIESDLLEKARDYLNESEGVK